MWGPTFSGFVNYIGWWTREVDIKLTLQELKLDIMGLAETLLREEGGIC